MSEKSSFDLNYEQMQETMRARRHDQEFIIGPYPSLAQLRAAVGENANGTRDAREVVVETPAEIVNTDPAGGSRFSAGKPRMWLLPWHGLFEVGRISEMGGRKYAPLDYMSGQSFSTLLTSGMDHMIEVMRDPLARDEESGHLHLGHAAWNILALLDAIERGDYERLDDVTPWQGVTAKTHRGKWTGSGSRP